MYYKSACSIFSLTGHPHHSLSHCQVSPSLRRLSPFLQVVPQMWGEAGRGELSLQQEAPLQVPAMVLRPPDSLKNNNKRLVPDKISIQILLRKTVLVILADINTFAT